jgi:signal transduction histidine kinase
MVAQAALAEINQTVDRATLLANQMLALAKVEQLRQQADLRLVDMAAIVRAVALDLAPLIAEKDLEFDIETMTTPSMPTNGCWASCASTCCTTPSKTAARAAP